MSLIAKFLICFYLLITLFRYCNSDELQHPSIQIPSHTIIYFQERILQSSGDGSGGSGDGSGDGSGGSGDGSGDGSGGSGDGSGGSGDGSGGSGDGSGGSGDGSGGSGDGSGDGSGGSGDGSGGSGDGSGGSEERAAQEEQKLRERLRNMTTEEFFDSFLNSSLLSAISVLPDLSASTKYGPNCNSLLTKLTTTIQCSKYLHWKPHVKLFHPRVKQQDMQCSSAQQILITSEILDDIPDPQNIYLLLPSAATLANQSTPSLEEWNSIFVKVPTRFDEVVLPAHYSGHQCSKQQEVKTFLMAILIVSSVFLIIGIGSAKIVGLELFGLLQLSYFNLVNHGSINVNLSALSQFGIFNGPHIVLFAEKSTSVSKQVANISMSSEFLNNFNIMGLLSFVVILAQLVCLKVFSVLGKNSLRVQAKQVLFQSIITLALFNAFDVGFSAGLHFKYSDPNNTSEAFHLFSTLFAVVMIISIISAAVFCQVGDESFFGEFKQKFKDSMLNKSYVPFILIYRLLLAVYLANENQNWEATLFSFGIQIFILIMFISNLPYSKALHNYRSGMVHVAITYVIFTSNYYGSMKMNTEIAIKSRLHDAATGELIVLGVCCVFSAVVTCYQVWMKIKQTCSKRQQKRQIEGKENKQQLKNNQINITIQDLIPVNK